MAKLAEPARLKHYEIVSRLGSGGMGVVYRARDTRLGRTVALKVLHPDLAQDQERSRRFEREARIVSALSHPGIATLYDFDRDGDSVFLTMELVEGPTLRERLAQGPVGVDEAYECAIQVADALAAAHAAGVVHRDLKPENVMRAGSGYYKVLDFGVARANEPDSATGKGTTHLDTRSWSTSAGELVGTVTYMSPEQAIGDHVDERSDVFSFGVVLYEMLTGDPPFRGANVVATADAILHGEPTALRERRPDVPEPLERIVHRCLAKARHERYRDARALADDLRAAREGRAVARPPRRRSLRRLAVLGASAVAGALVLSLVVVALRDTGRPAGVAAEQPRAIQTDRPRVLVARFENPGGDAEIDWLRAGLVEMLTTDLARSGGLEVVATQKLRDLAASAGDALEALDRDTVTGLARWAGASVVITGAVYKVGTTYRIDAQAYDTKTELVQVGHTVQGPDVLPLVNELTAGLLRGLRSSAGAPEAQGAPVLPPTRDPAAFRAYARAKELHERLDFGGEVAALREAIALDPGFDVARLDLSLALLADGETADAVEVIDELASRGATLSERERLLAQALHAFYSEGNVAAGTATLEDLRRRFSVPAAAYFAWAEAEGEVADEPLDAARTLRAAIASDPDNLLAIAALAARLRGFGDVEAAKTILDDAARRHPDRADALRDLTERLGPADAE